VKNSSLLSIFIKEFSHINALLFSLLIAISYFVLAIYLLNFRLVLQTIAANVPLSYKIAVLTVLLQGIQTAFAPFDILLLTITALLVGVNTVLFMKTIKKLKQQGPIAFSVGGAAIIGLITTGCASCGLSLLAIAGLSASVSFLPFHGNELHLLSIILLFISLWYLLKKLRENVYCRVKPKVKI